MSLLSQLWRLEGTVSRTTYLAAGVIGSASKYLLDWSIALLVFGREWSPLSYWRLFRFGEQDASGASLPMFLLLFAISLPFLWFAMAMTLLRLRDAGRSSGWAALLFVPVINAVLFIALCFVPSRRSNPPRDLSGVLESALFGVIASVALGILAVGLSTHLLSSYGIGLFVAVPFSVGYLSAFFHRRRHPSSNVQPFLIATFALVLLAGFLLAVAWEGVLCLVMSAPLALTAAFIGAYVGGRSAVSQPRLRGETGTLLIVAGLPLLLAGESMVRTTVPTFRTDSTIVIDAPIQQVWSNVISFSDITDTPEWYFRTGIAYPLRARIDGRGVGAVRYCEFTTGTFVEPVRIWDEPRLLRFDVTSSPAPMREVSPYGEVHPPHLSGFLVSKRGQFALRSLPDGKTELSGTTWYQHRLWPAAYWTWWSDAIIHRIHLRVLRHIKDLSESREKIASTVEQLS